uniref:NADH dehydrogenase [ubiquinone] 1 alpha subcomplex subunit 13 n=1 Tax=Corethron hystrix TaxID=216773 RepID=A0A7S1FYH9_9STRA|mmetsp:Transcript_37442/g.87322  ORF Transcript_37442/g.87322 Transcript_37442/m.87322 type:complete len:142 (+) Transcript_37442:78-503(+)|eukprot:CAMPEP_0113312150 /NCGR_PEP_ID=MMETSP0010_2-20120614/9092_1 /TAXON_ID=216773 ORGANISM="Corethron hystrix, Strain 308" /NCGR_SAMPLE_ID=MMETSP0010_2 /ASSEMBLY_ACC=CAM_ASM_000155 /LENGTH=141 /DNA_ID=CAMNT_0000167911 /DNA_START=74 /DNA_END=499 /DNA_ORIENTATION=+ /assembly_acc=CAM_ASM_000155
MSNVPPNIGPFVQDMPPKGGYPKIRTARHLPNRGPPGWALWSGTALLISYGFYQVGQGNQRRTREKMAILRQREEMVAELQAETDQEYAKREAKLLQVEAEIMKDVKGWKVGESPYFSGVWMPRAVYDFSTFYNKGKPPPS